MDTQFDWFETYPQQNLQRKGDDNEQYWLEAVNASTKRYFGAKERNIPERWFPILFLYFCIFFIFFFLNISLIFFLLF